eukprot:GHVN01073808.1.p1 GENE.GHVN01073808.1~~GHVN01073808.1.p1  ORF type:complete len:2014 (+),score=329.99 GHVN01073808.1:302-6343(+)
MENEEVNEVEVTESVEDSAPVPSANGGSSEAMVVASGDDEKLEASGYENQTKAEAVSPVADSVDESGPITSSASAELVEDDTVDSPYEAGKDDYHDCEANGKGNEACTKNETETSTQPLELEEDDDEEGEVEEEEVPFERLPDINPPNNSIVVYNLPPQYSSSTAYLSKMVQRFGQVVNVSPADHTMIGVVVTFAEKHEAVGAKSFLDKRKIRNRCVQVIFSGAPPPPSQMPPDQARRAIVARHPPVLGPHQQISSPVPRPHMHQPHQYMGHPQQRFPQGPQAHPASGQQIQSPIVVQQRFVKVPPPPVGVPVVSEVGLSAEHRPLSVGHPLRPQRPVMGQYRTGGGPMAGPVPVSEGCTVGELDKPTMPSGGDEPSGSPTAHLQSSPQRHRVILRPNPATTGVDVHVSAIGVDSSPAGRGPAPFGSTRAIVEKFLGPPASKWREDMSIDEQCDGATKMLKQYNVFNRYLVLRCVPEDVMALGEAGVKDLIVQVMGMDVMEMQEMPCGNVDSHSARSGYGLRDLIVEILKDKNHTDLVHVTFKTKRDAQTASEKLQALISAANGDASNSVAGGGASTGDEDAEHHDDINYHEHEDGQNEGKEEDATTDGDREEILTPDGQAAKSDQERDEKEEERAKTGEENTIESPLQKTAQADAQDQDHQDEKLDGEENQPGKADVTTAANYLAPTIPDLMEMGDEDEDHDEAKQDEGVDHALEVASSADVNQAEATVGDDTAVVADTADSVDVVEDRETDGAKKTESANHGISGVIKSDIHQTVTTNGAEEATKTMAETTENKLDGKCDDDERQSEKGAVSEKEDEEKSPPDQVKEDSTIKVEGEIAKEAEDSSTRETENSSVTANEASSPASQLLEQVSVDLGKDLSRFANMNVDHGAPRHPNTILWIGNAKGFALDDFAIHLPNLESTHGRQHGYGGRNQTSSLLAQQRFVQVFECFGKVKRYKLIAERSCGFVVYENVNDAVEARNALHGKKLGRHDINLNVDFAPHRDTDPPLMYGRGDQDYHSRRGSGSHRFVTLTATGRGVEVDGDPTYGGYARGGGGRPPLLLRPHSIAQITGDLLPGEDSQNSPSASSPMQPLGAPRGGGSPVSAGGSPNKRMKHPICTPGGAMMHDGLLAQSPLGAVPPALGSPPVYPAGRGGVGRGGIPPGLHRGAGGHQMATPRGPRSRGGPMFGHHGMGAPMQGGQVDMMRGQRPMPMDGRQHGWDMGGRGGRAAGGDIGMSDREMCLKNDPRFKELLAEYGIGGPSAIRSPAHGGAGGRVGHPMSGDVVSGRASPDGKDGHRSLSGGRGSRRVGDWGQNSHGGRRQIDGSISPPPNSDVPHRRIMGPDGERRRDRDRGLRERDRDREREAEEHGGSNSREGASQFDRYGVKRGGSFEETGDATEGGRGTVRSRSVDSEGMKKDGERIGKGEVVNRGSRKRQAGIDGESVDKRRRRSLEPFPADEERIPSTWNERDRIGKTHQRYGNEQRGMGGSRMFHPSPGRPGNLRGSGGNAVDVAAGAAGRGRRRAGDWRDDGEESRRHYNEMGVGGERGISPNADRRRGGVDGRRGPQGGAPRSRSRSPIPGMVKGESAMSHGGRERSGRRGHGSSSLSPPVPRQTGRSRIDRDADMEGYGSGPRFPGEGRRFAGGDWGRGGGDGRSDDAQYGRVGYENFGRDHGSRWQRGGREEWRPQRQNFGGGYGGSQMGLGGQSSPPTHSDPLGAGRGGQRSNRRRRDTSDPHDCPTPTDDRPSRGHGGRNVRRKVGREGNSRDGDGTPPLKEQERGSRGRANGPSIRSTSGTPTPSSSENEAESAEPKASEVAFPPTAERTRTSPHRRTTPPTSTTPCSEGVTEDAVTKVKPELGAAPTHIKVLKSGEEVCRMSLKFIRGEESWYPPEKLHVWSRADAARLLKQLEQSNWRNFSLWQLGVGSTHAIKYDKFCEYFIKKQRVGLLEWDSDKSGAGNGPIGSFYIYLVPPLDSYMEMFKIKEGSFLYAFILKRSPTPTTTTNAAGETQPS